VIFGAYTYDGRVRVKGALRARLRPLDLTKGATKDRWNRVWVSSYLRLGGFGLKTRVGYGDHSDKITM